MTIFEPFIREALPRALRQTISTMQEEQANPYVYEGQQAILDQIKPEDIQSSQDWYNQMNGTVYDAKTKAYMFNSTRDIVNQLGLQDKISDDMLDSYLSSGQVKELDTMLLNTAKDSWVINKDSELRNALLSTGDIEERRRLLEEYKKKKFPYSLDNIIQFRADLYSKYQADKAEKEQGYGVNEAPDGFKEASELLNYKAQVLAQLTSKVGSYAQESDWGEKLQEIYPEFVFPVNAVHNYGIFSILEDEGLIKEKGMASKLYHSVLSGSGRKELRDLVWSWNKQDFDKFMYLVEKTNLLSFWPGGPEQAPLKTLSFLQDIGSITGTEVLATNALEGLGFLGMKADYTDLVRGGMSSIRSRGLLKNLDEFMTAGRSEDFIKTWNKFKETPFGKKWVKLVKAKGQTKESAKAFKEFLDSSEGQQFRKTFSNVLDEVTRRAREAEEAAANTIDADFTILDTGSPSDIGERVPMIERRRSTKGFKQAVDITSQEFKEWSKGKPIVYPEQTTASTFKTGKPVLVKAYHGSGEVISRVDESLFGVNTGVPSAKRGFFATKDKTVAASYAKGAIPEKSVQLQREFDLAEAAGDSIRASHLRAELDRQRDINTQESLAQGYINEMYINMENPFVYDYKGASYRDQSYDELIQKAIDEGYDSVVFLNTFDSADQSKDLTNIYITFDGTKARPVYERFLNLDEYNSLKGQSLVNASLSGSSSAVDNINGARLSAEAKYKSSITEILNNPAKELTIEETFSMIPSMLAGASRNTVPYLKNLNATGDFVTDTIKKENPYLTDEQLSTFINMPGVETYDPDVFAALSNTAQQTFENNQAWISSQPVDVIQSDLKIDSTISGVNVKQLFGVGPKGNSPITKETLDSIQKYAKEGGFEVHQDKLGNLWLAQEGFLSAEGLWTPLVSKDPGYIASTLASIEVTEPWENIKDIRYAASTRAGVMATLKASLNKAIKGMDSKQKGLAEAIITEERERNKLLTQDDLYEAANYDEKVVELVNTVRDVNKIEGSLKNNLRYDKLNSEGFKDLELSGLPSKVKEQVKNLDKDLDFFREPMTAKLIEEPKLSEINKDFVLDLTKGELVYPNALREVPAGSKVWKLSKSEMIGKTDKVDYLLVPETIKVNPLSKQQIGVTAYAGMNYKGNVFIKYPRELGLDSAGRNVGSYEKTIGYDTSYRGAKKQIAALKEWAEIYNSALSKAQKDIAILRASVKNGITSISTVDDYIKFLKAHNAEDLSKVEVAEKLTLKANNTVSFSPTDAGIEDSITSQAAIGTAHRWMRGDYTIKNLRHSADRASMVPLERYMTSTIRRAGQIAGPGRYIHVASNRWIAKYGNLIDWTKNPKSPLDAMENFEFYVDAAAKDTPESAYVYARNDANNILRALDFIRADREFKRAANKVYSKLGLSNVPGVSTLSDFMQATEPVKRLQGLMYNLYFTAVLPQIVVQSAAVLPVIVQHPVHGSRALAGYLPVRYMMGVILRNGDLNKEASLLAQMPSNQALASKGYKPWSAQEIKVMAQTAIRNGLQDLALNDLRGSNIYENPFVRNSVVSGLKRAGTLGRAPFNEANLFARLVGMMTAAGELSKDTGKAVSLFADPEWTEVIAKADIFSGGLTSANKRLFTELPGGNIISMMESYGLTAFESMLGPTIFIDKTTRTLDPKKNLRNTLLKRALYAGLMLSAFGAVHYTDSATARKQGLNLKTTALDMGFDEEFADRLGSWGSGGFLQLLMNHLLGYDVDLGRINKKLFDTLFFNAAEAILLDKDEQASEYEGFFLSTTKGIADKIVKIADIWKDPESADPDFKALDWESKVEWTIKELLNYFPATKDWYRYFLAKENNIWIDSKGLDRLSTYSPRVDLAKKALIQATTGISPADEKGLTSYVLYDSITEETERYNNWIKTLSNIEAQAIKQRVQGDVQNAIKTENFLQHQLLVAKDTLNLNTDYKWDSFKGAVHKSSTNKLDPKTYKQYLTHPYLEDGLKHELKEYGYEQYR